MSPQCHACATVACAPCSNIDFMRLLQELLQSGYLTEVHKFSKFIHGSATLMPDMVQARPFTRFLHAIFTAVLQFFWA